MSCLRSIAVIGAAAAAVVFLLFEAQPHAQLARPPVYWRAGLASGRISRRCCRKRIGRHGLRR
jgi:hypothetical protein